MSAPELRSVPAKPKEPPPDMSYEHRERAYIMGRNWSGVHVNGDRGPVVCWQTRVRRWWRG